MPPMLLQTEEWKPPLPNTFKRELESKRDTTKLGNMSGKTSTLEKVLQVVKVKCTGPTNKKLLTNRLFQ
jgi:hypothetical protein